MTTGLSIPAFFLPLLKMFLPIIWTQPCMRLVTTLINQKEFKDETDHF